LSAIAASKIAMMGNVEHGGVGWHEVTLTDLNRVPVPHVLFEVFGDKRIMRGDELENLIESRFVHSSSWVRLLVQDASKNTGRDHITPKFGDQNEKLRTRLARGFEPSDFTFLWKMSE
jgi:hypothetical protein